MAKIIYKGKINGEFQGFNDSVLFSLANGTYWVQAEYKYWYHYAYNPEVTISEEDGHYFISVAGSSIRVRRVSDVIESRIDGHFNGWHGNTSYKLQNGQEWEQATALSLSANAYAPEVVIYNSGYGYKMMVAGTVADVRRIR